MTTNEFNQRTQRARMSAGWAQDSAHYHFMRQHDSRAPFVEPKSADTFASALVGVVCFFGMILLLLLMGSY